MQSGPPVGLGRAVTAGGMVYISSIGPVDLATGRVVSGEITEQARQCLQNLQARLEAAGSSLDNVVWANWSLRDPAEFDIFNEEWVRWFPGDSPVGQGTLMPRAATARRFSDLARGDRPGPAGRGGRATDARGATGCPPRRQGCRVAGKQPAANPLASPPASLTRRRAGRSRPVARGDFRRQPEGSRTVVTCRAVGIGREALTELVTLRIETPSPGLDGRRAARTGSPARTRPRGRSSAWPRRRSRSPRRPAGSRRCGRSGACRRPSPGGPRLAFTRRTRLMSSFTKSGRRSMMWPKLATPAPASSTARRMSRPRARIASRTAS